MLRGAFDNPRYHLPCILVLCLVRFFAFLGARDFWDFETHFAEVIRVMALDGNYFVPTMNGELWTENPPLYFWLAALFTWLTGRVNEWIIRLPSALSAAELILFFYFFNFYSGIKRFETLEGPKDFARFLGGPAPRYLLVRERSLSGVKKAWRGDLTAV